MSPARTVLVTSFFPLLALAMLSTTTTTALGQPGGASPEYSDHQDPTYYLDAGGARHPVKTLEDWKTRRRHILAGMEKAMGPVPDMKKRVPLDVQQVEQVPLDDRKT